MLAISKFDDGHRPIIIGFHGAPICKRTLVNTLQHLALHLTGGLRPDLIVGCSSGALFGAALALGLAPAHVLRMASGLWTQELTEQRRWKAYLQLQMPKLAPAPLPSLRVAAAQIISEPTSATTHGAMPQ